MRRGNAATICSFMARDADDLSNVRDCNVGGFLNMAAAPVVWAVDVHSLCDIMLSRVLLNTAS